MGGGACRLLALVNDEATIAKVIAWEGIGFLFFKREEPLGHVR